MSDETRFRVVTDTIDSTVNTIVGILSKLPVHWVYGILKNVSYRITEINEPKIRTWLEEKFDEQVNKYVSIGFPAAAGMTEEEFREYLLPLRHEVASPPCKHVVRKNYKALLLVIPPEVVPIRQQLKLMQNIVIPDAKLGANTILRAVEDTRRFEGGVVEADFSFSRVKSRSKRTYPRAPYVLLDVHGGIRTYGMSPEQYFHELQYHERIGCNVAEGVALAIMVPNILREHSVNLLDVLYGERDIAVLTLRGSTTPILTVAGIHNIGIGSDVTDRSPYERRKGNASYAKMVRHPDDTLDETLET